MAYIRKTPPPRGGENPVIQGHEEIIHDGALQGKGGKPQEPQERHLEDLPEIEHRQGVDPLGDGKPIPGFPPEAADQARGQETKMFPLLLLLLM